MAKSTTALTAGTIVQAFYSQLKAALKRPPKEVIEEAQYADDARVLYSPLARHHSGHLSDFNIRYVAALMDTASLNTLTHFDSAAPELFSAITQFLNDKKQMELMRPLLEGTTNDDLTGQLSAALKDHQAAKVKPPSCYQAGFFTKALAVTAAVVAVSAAATFSSPQLNKGLSHEP